MATPPPDKTGKEAENAEAGAEKAAAPAAGGFKAWLPLVIAVVTMPALAYATTKFVLLPKIEHATSGEKGAESSSESSSKESGEKSKEGEKSEKSEKGEKSGKAKTTVALSKILVNVSGTLGTRYLMTSVTLVGNGSDFKGKIEDNKDQLMDLANGTLSTKTIADLEKPGARNVIRSELMTVFNNALGSPVVQEIYITEMAIQ